MRLAFSPYSDWLGIAALVGITASTFYVDGLQYAVLAFLPFLAAMSLMYWKSCRRNGAAKRVNNETAAGEK